ncbi:MAG: fumarylacetoacetase [Phycisphaerae bacterium]|nr:fumarylacetoacetase [Phycisphaerae bacterium]
MTLNTLDQTHDPSLRSWLESANDPSSAFPIQNLPFCTIVPPDNQRATVAVAIGDCVIDLNLLFQARLLDGIAGIDELGKGALDGVAWNLNALLELPRTARVGLRHRLCELLREDNHGLRDNPRLLEVAMRPIKDTEFGVPVEIGDYTDFYASIHHASTVGAMFRPENPLLPNYKHVPIGYHGRSSSIVVSGTDIHRPVGQQSPPEADPAAGPTFGPCRMLDYELEVGCFIAGTNNLGEPTLIENAWERIGGLCLLNDWSARDIQKWEYQPLGPFLAKNFASTVSPFVITPEALAPFRIPASARPSGDPRPLNYLLDKDDQTSGGFDITLEVLLQTKQMRANGEAPMPVCKTRAFRDMYWTFAQMIAHHTSGGCNLRPGDLLGSGTVSGPGPSERGCLLEATWDGPGKPRKPIQLPSGETRTFLADHDTVLLRAFCEKPGFRRIGFGDCSGTILPVWG